MAYRAIFFVLPIVGYLHVGFYYMVFKAATRQDFGIPYLLAMWCGLRAEVIRVLFLIFATFATILSSAPPYFSGRLEAKFLTNQG